MMACWCFSEDSSSLLRSNRVFPSSAASWRSAKEERRKRAKLTRFADGYKSTVKWILPTETMSESYAISKQWQSKIRTRYRSFCSVVKAGGIFDACIERFPLKTSSVHRSDGTNGWKCWNAPIKQRNLYECHLDERCNRLTGGEVGIRIITCPFVFPQSNVNHESAIWIRGWGVCCVSERYSNNRAWPNRRPLYVCLT